MSNFDVESRMTRELSGGERLLWSGRPGQGVMLRRSDIFMIPFSLMWGGFAIFWEATVIVTNAPLLFKLAGVPFVIMGLYLIVGRFFADARIRERTMYAVTNERVIILSGFLKESVRSVNLKTIPEITLDEHGGGRGTVQLGTRPSGGFMPASQDSTRPSVPALESIEDARRIYELIRQAQKDAS